MKQIEPMNLEKLLTKFQEYYGGIYEKLHIEAYLDEFGDADNLFIGAIYVAVRRRFPIKWGKLPDIAVVNEFIDDVYRLVEDARKSVTRIDAPPEEEMTEEEVAEAKAKFREFVDRLKNAKTISCKDSSLPEEPAVVR